MTFRGYARLPVPRVLWAATVATSLLLAACDEWDFNPPDPAPDIALTAEQVRSVRMKGGWGALPLSAEDVRYHLYKPKTDFETQFLRFRASNEEADALSARLVGKREYPDEGVGCLGKFHRAMAWWPQHCPENAFIAQRSLPGRGNALLISQRGDEKTTLWLVLGGEWH